MKAGLDSLIIKKKMGPGISRGAPRLKKNTVEKQKETVTLIIKTNQKCISEKKYTKK